MELLKDNWLKASIVLYILGFVVHNTYLAQFGSHEFELVQAKYILAGFGAIAFSAICFAFISIKLNLSYIFESLQIDNLFPWLLRIVSLPYVVYAVLYVDSLESYIISADGLTTIAYFAFLIASFVVAFSIMDLVFMYSEGNSWNARFLRSFLRVSAIPMIIVTLFIGWNNPDFSSVVKTSTYFFFGLLGLGLRQEDRRHGINPDYLHPNTEEKHQDIFTVFFGIIAISFIAWTIVSNYVDAIYPKIPVALGGSELEPAKIYANSSVIDSKIIQESDSWILYINNETNGVEKLKSDIVQKIVYVGAVEGPNQ